MSQRNDQGQYLYGAIICGLVTPINLEEFQKNTSEMLRLKTNEGLYWDI